MPYAVTIPEGLEEKIRAGKILETELVKALEQYVSGHPSLAGIIDSEQADGGDRKTQDEWIKYFNEQGRLMISAPDIYRAAKKGSDHLIESLRNDFYESEAEEKNTPYRHGLVTSTRVVYHNADGRNATIIHNVNSKIVKPKEYEVIVPHYGREWAILRTSEGLAYLRALFDTNDRPEIIEHTLIKLSGKSKGMFSEQPVCDGCYFNTPNPKWKRDVMETATLFCYGTEQHLGFGYYGDLQIRNLCSSKDTHAEGVSRAITFPRLEKAIDDCEQPPSFFGKVRALLTRAPH